MNDIPIFDISADYDQPVFVGEDGYQKNCEYCKQFMKNNGDVLFREFTLSNGKRCSVIFVDGMCSKDMVERQVILPARRFAQSSDENKFCSDDGVLQQFSATEYKREKSISNGYISALTGDVLVIVEGEPVVFVFGYRFINSRSVGTSTNEGSVFGPHEAFTENFRINTGLLRRRISDPNFVIEHLKVGQRSHTSVGLCYIRGLTNDDLVEKLRLRLQNIDIDIINDAGEIEQLIEEQPSGLFPQASRSELPDTVAGEICNGRAALLVSGSPQALVLPGNLALLMRVNEDSYQRWSFSTFIKILRWIAMIISVAGPSLYVAMVAFHPGLLPTDLLMISAINRLNVPFSALAEVLIIEFFLELLREASIRMPSNITTALSIVGGLIIGDAAINAGLISPLLIIIVGLTTIAGFTIPSYSLASSLRLIKYMLLLFTSVLGLPGFIFGIVIWAALMVKSSSFGLDFTVPISPFDKYGLIRGFVQLPLRKRTTRPAYLSTNDVRRLGNGGNSQ